MYFVGLTGTIASGKTTVGQLFKQKKITVLSADEIARELTRPSEICFVKIAEKFGNSIVNIQGELDRKKLRQLVFEDKKKRIWLEELLHPPIRELFYERALRSSSAYTLLEIPLLRKRENYPYLDRVLLVLAEKKLKIDRVILRDNSDEKMVETILATQANELELIKLADDVVQNNDSIEELANKVEKLHLQYLQLANQKS